jgi:hypothetical protein
MPVKICCLVVETHGQECKIEVNYDRQRWAMWFLWKGDIKPSDIHQLSAVCGEKAPVCRTELNRVWNSTVARKLQRQLSKSGTVTPLMNSSLKLSGSSQEDCSDIQT